MEDGRLFRKRMEQILQAIANRKQIIERNSNIPHFNDQFDSRLAFRRRLERYLETANQNKKNAKEIVKAVTIKKFSPVERRHKLSKALIDFAKDTSNFQKLGEMRINSIRAIAEALFK